MTRFELEEREQVEEDTTEVDWMNDTTGTDTIEYHAVDLVYDVETSTFNLNNEAQLKYRTATLDADTILFDQENEVLMASGEPVLRETKADGDIYGPAVHVRSTCALLPIERIRPGKGCYEQALWQ